MGGRGVQWVATWDATQPKLAGNLKAEQKIPVSTLSTCRAAERNCGNCWIMWLNEKMTSLWSYTPFFPITTNAKNCTTLVEVLPFRPWLSTCSMTTKNCWRGTWSSPSVLASSKADSINVLMHSLATLRRLALSTRTGFLITLSSIKTKDNENHLMNKLLLLYRMIGQSATGTVYSMLRSTARVTQSENKLTISLWYSIRFSFYLSQNIPKVA